MNTSLLTVLLADDHALFRDGMRHLLRQMEPDLILFETASHDAALERLTEHPEIDLALVDLNLPSRDGVELLDALLNRSQALPVVVLSATEDAQVIRRVLEAGAMGFIPKSEAAEIMLGALRLVLSGGIYVPPLLVRSDSRPRLAALTPRQHDVLQGLAQGKSNREVGDLLGLSEATIKVHVTAIFKSLNVSNRTQAVKLAEQRGLVNASVSGPRPTTATAVSAE